MNHCPCTYILRHHLYIYKYNVSRYGLYSYYMFDSLSNHLTSLSEGWDTQTSIFISTFTIFFVLASCCIYPILVYFTLQITLLVLYFRSINYNTCMNIIIGKNTLCSFEDEFTSVNWLESLRPAGDSRSLIR
jgi:hypothetical protein